MPSITSRLVGLTHEISYPRLPQATIAAAKRTVLDTLGCAIAAQGCEPARIAARVAPAGGSEATVIGAPGRACVERAVLLNGILVRYLDMMDVYWAKDICHPAENVPLALACVESTGGGGRRLIETVVAGYEAQLRLTHALSFHDLGMHHVTAAGIVAPLVIGKAWGLAPAVIEQAVALGGCRQFTLHALSKGGLSMAKAIGYPWSAMTGVFAVRLAQEGFTGPVEFLDWLADDGPLKSQVERAALEHDGRYLIEAVSFKQFPVQFELQTAGEIAVGLHARLKTAGAIEAIEIEVAPATIGRTADAAKFKPQNRETADHSLPVCVAMALADGKLTAAQFETDRWTAPDVAALVARTRVVANPDYPKRYPGARPVRVTLRLAGGEALSEFLAVPSGDATRPMDDATLERKFLANAAPNAGEKRAEAILACVNALEDLERIDELTRLLAAPP